jgi:hypothetical protein
MTMGDGPDGRDDDGASREAVFAMDPQTVVWELTRQLVRGHTELATFRRSAAAARRALPRAPVEVEKYLADFVAFEKGWYTETLPMLTASFRLALEVYDTFGPGATVIDDPTEAAIWNNKHHVWFTELSSQFREDN